MNAYDRAKAAVGAWWGEVSDEERPASRELVAKVTEAIFQAEVAAGEEVFRVFRQAAAERRGEGA